MADTTIEARIHKIRESAISIVAGVAILPDGSIPKGGNSAFSEYRIGIRKAINTALSVRRGFVRTVLVVGPSNEIEYLRNHRAPSDLDHIRYLPMQSGGVCDVDPVELARQMIPDFKNAGVKIVNPVAGDVSERLTRQIHRCFRDEDIKISKTLPCSQLKKGVELQEILEKEHLRLNFSSRVRRVRRTLHRWF